VKVEEGYLEKGHIMRGLSLSGGRRGEGNETRREQRLTVYKEQRSELSEDYWVTLGVRGPTTGLPQDVKWRLQKAA
jgi:hypothetical protein